MPRGSGKDTIAECAVLWALMYGYRLYVVFIGATQPLADRSLKKIKSELETNDLLLADFPEVCYPIRALERNTLRARMQTCQGEFTRMEWTADTLILPTIAGSVASGAAVQALGLTGAIRGLSVMGPDGKPRRPDFVIASDPQTRESAKSPTQTADREAILSDDVMMLAGPTTKIAFTMLCTVIYRNDLSDRYLDADKHPEFRRVRTKMVESMPKNMEAWDQYAEARRAGLREGDGGKAGNEFYSQRREVMDAGAVLSWPERVKDGDLSGLQSAMNVFYENRRGFFAELQNDPEAEDLGAGAKEFNAEAIAKRLSGGERYSVPTDCTRLTCFIDCGASILWYGVAAWNESFGGTVIDYGTWPRQPRTFFAAADARPSLTDAFRDQPSITTEAQRVYAGLERLTSEILGRKYFRVGGGEARIELCLIDSGWQSKTVYQFAERYAGHYGCPVRPSKGIGRTATARGVSEWKPRPGERKGYFWRQTAGEFGKVQSVQFDPDAWKSFLHSALSTAAGGSLGLWLYGKSAAAHEMIGEHVAAEYATPVTVRGTTFDKWEQRPDRPDNHLLDVLVGCAVGASVLGVQWSATPDGKPEPKKDPAPRKRFSEMQREKMEARR